MITHETLLMGRHEQYPLTEKMAANLGVLWFRVNALLATRPGTYTVTSGYRPGEYNKKAGGSPNSSHMTCEAVDIADGDGSIDAWLDANPKLLVEFNLYREHPSATKGWVHLTTRAPASKRRTFYP